MSINAVIPPFQYKERPVGGRGGGARLAAFSVEKKSCRRSRRFPKFETIKIGHYFPENFHFLKMCDTWENIYSRENIVGETLFSQEV